MRSIPGVPDNENESAPEGAGRRGPRCEPFLLRLADVAQNQVVSQHAVFLSQAHTAMKFIEMTGATLSEILNDGELHERDFESAGINDFSIVRINQQGDIEIRRSLKWDVIGGLLGSFDERVRQTTGFDWA